MKWRWRCGCGFITKHWDLRNRANLIVSATPCNDAQMVGRYRASSQRRLTTVLTSKSEDYTTAPQHKHLLEISELFEEIFSPEVWVSMFGRCFKYLTDSCRHSVSNRQNQLKPTRLFWHHFKSKIIKLINYFINLFSLVQLHYRQHEDSSTAISQVMKPLGETSFSIS